MAVSSPSPSLSPSNSFLQLQDKVSERTQWRRCRAITFEDTFYVLQSFGDEAISYRLVEKFEFMVAKGLRRRRNSVSNSQLVPGLMYYAICRLGKDIYLFGGSSKPDSDFHNSLMKFNIDTSTLRSVLPLSEDFYNAPIKKHGCGMITLKSEDQNFLVTFGGAGNTPPPFVLPTLEAHAKYISCQQKPHICYTNEVWVTCLSTFPGKWNKCEVEGDFDPRAFFSADTLPDNRGIIFGGQIIVGDRFERSDDVFLVSFNKRKLIFSRAKKSPRLQAWPPKRYHHASTVISSSADNGETQQYHLVILGGCNDKVISDCWIMNIDKTTWQKIELPDNVTRRQKHSLSSFSLGPNIVWLLVHGGYKKGSDTVSPHDSFVIVKLGFNPKTGVWCPEKILTDKEIETPLQYQQLLLDFLIENTRLLQSVSRRSVAVNNMPSPQSIHKQCRDKELLLEEALQEKTEQTFALEDQNQQLRTELQEAFREKKEKMSVLQNQNQQLLNEVQLLQKQLGKETAEKQGKIDSLERELKRTRKESQQELRQKESRINKLEQEMKQQQQKKERERKSKQEELTKKDDTLRDLQKKIQILQNQSSEDARKSERELKSTKENAEKVQKELNEKLSKTVLNFNNIAQELDKKDALLKDMLKMKEQEQLESNKLKMHGIPQQLDEMSNKHDDSVEEPADAAVKAADAAFKAADAKLRELQEEFKNAKLKLDTLSNKKNPKPQWIVDEKEIEIFHDRAPLGKGSYGTVRIAKFRGTHVAAKSIHNHPGIKGFYGSVFFREMGISSQIHHPNIVQFIAAAATDGEVPILLYELMTTNLHKKLYSSTVSFELNEVLRVTIDILSALAYLHGWKPDAIIHRDLSSSNVLMEPCGANRWRSKLSDFGSANLQRHTKTEWPGNRCYAAPEAENPELHTTSMDIYSLGVLIMEMNIKTPPLRSPPAERFENIKLMTFIVLKPIVERCMADTNTDRPETKTLLREVTSLLVEEDRESEIPS